VTGPFDVRGGGEHAGTARPPDARADPPDAGPWTVPNALTALRLVLAPCFLVLYVSGDTARSLWCFGAAAATDLLDGLAARLLRQHSRVGEFLDPIADKLLALCALLALLTAGRIGAWLPALVVARDAALLAGSAVLQAVGRQVPIHPTRAGKYATFTLALLIAGELVVDVGVPAITPGPDWRAALGLVAAACVIVSWMQYGLVFGRVLRGAEAAPESR
jgi:cardiolipin synthase